MTARDAYPKTSQVWLDVISAVDYLSRGPRPGLTVYDALEEALRWHTAALIAGIDDVVARAVGQLPWDDPDPLRTALDGLLAHEPSTTEGPTSDKTLHSALAAWVDHMAAEYNDGHRWASPVRVQPPKVISPVVAGDLRFG